MSDQDRVSVVVCSYDVARFEQLTACLDSLRHQTLAPEQIVAVVDGDPRIIQALAATTGTSDGLMVVELPTNQGLSAARNEGLRVVRTPRVAFLDDDAVAEPTWLQALVVAARQTEATGCGGLSLPLYEGADPRWMPRELLWTVGCSFTDYGRQRMMVRNVFGGCALFETAALTALDGFSEKLGRRGAGHQGGEEADLCLRAVEADPSARFVIDPNAVIHHKVPRERARVAYVLRRCYAEGQSKAQVAISAGAAGLSSERSFIASVPLALLRHFCRGRLRAMLVLVAGVASAAVGYLAQRVRAALVP